LQQAYRDGWWGKNQAGQSERLEAVLREYHQVEHVLLCASGNYAVELGLRALKIAPGDEVILADYDYPGNLLGIHAVQAIPVLVDVDSRRWNLSIESVREAV
jgi:dTDP-4-amino-4,6-dideoxygalactose transaminase